MLHCENNIKINHLHYCSCNCYFQSSGEAVLNVGNYISNQSSGPACESKFSKFGIPGKHSGLHQVVPDLREISHLLLQGMPEGVRNHNVPELCFPVRFSMGSGCALHCTEEEREELGFEGWRGIFWKSHLENRGC